MTRSCSRIDVGMVERFACLSIMFCVHDDVAYVVLFGGIIMTPGGGA